MQMVNLTIDGKQIQAPAGSSVLEAATPARVFIFLRCAIIRTCVRRVPAACVW